MSLKGLLEREYFHERSEYTADKRIANLMSDMGFAIADDDKSNGVPSKFHRLIKRTDKHMIVVTYELRDRLLGPFGPYENPSELMKSLSPNTFVSFLKKHGVLPPNTVGDEHDEETQIREEGEARKHPLAD